MDDRTPPRRFQVLGYVESSGLGGITDKVYSVGGDAAIIVAKGTRYLGSVSNSSNWFNGSGSAYGGGYNFSGHWWRASRDHAYNEERGVLLRR